MAHGLLAPVAVDMIVQRAGMALRLLLVQEFENLRESRLAVGSRGDDFNAVAGRKDNPFVDGRVSAQAPERIAHIRFFESDALAYFDGRAAMIQSDNDDFFLHGLVEP